MIQLALGAAIGFSVLALVVTLGATRPLDLMVITAFQSIASPAIDTVVNAHTLVGQLAITLPLSVLVALVVQRRLGGYAWLGPLFILATGAIELAFKLLVAHPGPPREFIRAFGNPLGIPREFHPPFSFPSGHMARISFLAVVVSGLWPRPWVLALGAAFVGFSLFARVYIGDHWISDAAAGLALGTAVGAVAILWMRRTARR